MSRENGDLNPPEELVRATEQTFPGDGHSVEEAIGDAYEKGKRSGHRVFRVQDIYVYGDNPISGYRVVVIPGP